MRDLLSDTIPYFAGLTPWGKESLGKHIKHYFTEAGEIPFFQGELSSSWVVILKGTYHYKESDESGRIVKEKLLSEGESLNLENLYTPSVNQGTLKCLSGGEIIGLNRDHFHTFVRENPSEVKNIMKSVPAGERAFWKQFMYLKSEDRILFRFRKSRRLETLKGLPLSLVLFAGGILLQKFLPAPWGNWLGLMFIGASLFPLLKSFITIVCDEYTINAASVCYRSWKFPSFHIDTLKIPLESIEKVELIKKKRLLRLMGISSLNIYTGSARGNLKIESVQSAEKIVVLINELKAAEEKHGEARDLKLFREAYNSYYGNQNYFEAEEKEVVKDYHFHRSLAALMTKIAGPVVYCLFTAALIVLLNTAFSDYKKFIPLVILSALPSSVIALWRWADWGNDRYAIEGADIIDIEKKPLWGKETRSYSDIFKVQNVRSQQKNILQCLFNYGDVILDLTGAAEPLVFYSIRNPSGVIDQIVKRKEYINKENKNRERSTRQKEVIRLVDYFKQLETEGGEK